MIANPGFESGTTGWFGFGGPTLAATAQAHSGAQSLLVTDRTAAFQGPGYSLLSVATRARTRRAAGRGSTTLPAPRCG